jgi:DNA-binding transcriptional LysR family regulator
MYTNAHRGVPLTERVGESTRTQVPDWQTLRIFLELARRGSFRAAAESLGVSINVVRRRIDELENQIGTKLVVRHVHGATITGEGRQILAVAQNMELASFGVIHARERAVPEVSGQVKLAATEAFGTFWLAPRLVEFQRANPQLVVDLSCAMRSADVLRLEAEAAVQLTKPTAPDLKLVRLGRIHSMPCAAPSYIATYGMPKSADDLRKHRLALQFAEQTSTQELYDQHYPDMPQNGFVAFRTNNSSALLWAILKGAGVGWSPTYMHAMGPKMIPLDIGMIFSFDIWLTYHPDAAQLPRVRRLIDWVIASFDPKTFPWFRDEFIHPRDLAREYHGPPLVNLFERRSGAAD